MGNNKHKFSFIICTNNDAYYEECRLYIDRLRIPDGFCVEVIPVRGAKSMCSGYNEGMKKADGKFKIYLHQDVFILNPEFLSNLLYIFKSDHKIGMIGMIGSEKLPASAVPWHGERVGSLYEADKENVFFEGYDIRDEKIIEVEAIDGLMMATKEDIPWREDIFDGWDYYDLSQSKEFIKRGLKVVVPNQQRPWCAHDDGIMNLWNYNFYRKKFMEEYMK